MGQSTDKFLQEETLNTRSTWEDVIKQCAFNPQDVRAGDLPRGTQHQFERLYEYLGKELPNLTRILDERIQVHLDAAVDEIVKKIDDAKEG